MTLVFSWKLEQLWVESAVLGPVASPGILIWFFKVGIVSLQLVYNWKMHQKIVYPSPARTSRRPRGGSPVQRVGGHGDVLAGGRGAVDRDRPIAMLDFSALTRPYDPLITVKHCDTLSLSQGRS